MSTQETVQAMEYHMTCEVYAESDHFGHFPKTHEDLNFVNNHNGFCLQNQGWNQGSNTQVTIIILITCNV
jgi:hypothetical protein